MATQTYVDGVTLTSATEFNRFDTVAYSVFSSVTGTNTITATGPANYTYTSTTPAVWLTPGFTNTSTATINVTPFGGVALGAKNIFSGGAALAGGELVAGVPVAVIYDGTQFNIIGGALSGSWTPSVGGNATYTTQVGRYRRIGNVVHIWMHLQINAIGTGSINTVSGLPFTCNALVAGCYAVGSFNGLAAALVSIQGFTQQGATTIVFNGNTAGNGSATQLDIFQNGASIQIYGSYYV